MKDDETKENENETEAPDEDPQGLPTKKTALQMSDLDERREAAKPKPKRGRKPVSECITTSDIPPIPPRGKLAQEA